MKSRCSGFRRSIAALPSVAIVLAFAWLLLSSDGVVAQKSKTAQRPYEDFDNKKFSRSTKIDNQWLPLMPGTQRVYEGFSMEGKKRAARKLVVIVTDLTKVIDGVRALVVWDVDYVEGKMVETEIAFFAQDDVGNVWYIGEYPEEHEGGKFVKAPAWLQGHAGARAGIMMQAEPRLGTPSYSQGWGPAVAFSDRGKVDQMGVKTCVRAGCYDDVLVVAESSKEERNAEQLKYYARAVGNVRVGWRGKGEKLQETLELTEIVNLSPEALAKARAAALDLDKRAYRNSRKAYAGTPPAEPISTAPGQ
jgi:hypothetical protein